MPIYADRIHEADRGCMIGDRRTEKDRKSKERQEMWERRRETSGHTQNSGSSSCHRLCWHGRCTVVLPWGGCHAISHPGIHATKRLILSRFVWKHAAADITALTCACLPCQRGKITNYIHAREASPHSGSRPPLQPLAPGPGGPLTSVRWMHDCTYLFTIIDFTTQWVEVIPLATTSTADCACM